MHIIIAVLGGLTALFFAFRYFVSAAHEGQEALRDAQGLWRSGKWSRKANQRLVETIADPREAAAIALYQIASYAGAITERQRDVMLSLMRNEFQADDQTVNELFAFARMAVGQVADAGGAMRKLVAPIEAHCNADERKRFLVMLETMAQAEGDPTEAQTRFVTEARRRLAPSH
ncbi:MAG: TerB family tellurite resistance protein [Pseudomonadota bacterium]